MRLLFDQETVLKTVRRMTYEIKEKNESLDQIILIGILKKGMPIATLIRDNIRQYANVDIELHGLDISRYRDDEKKKPGPMIDFSTNDKICLLVDDVLYTGRTIRAAMTALVEAGRPKRIELAVLIDRGHRELPIRADYVGKNIPTAKDETVIVDLHSEHQGVYLERNEEKPR